jgi:hypothetical protein
MSSAIMTTMFGRGGGASAAIAVETIADPTETQIAISFVSFIVRGSSTEG